MTFWDWFDRAFQSAEKEIRHLRSELAAEREKSKGKNAAEINLAATAKLLKKVEAERDATQQKADDEFASMSEQINTFVCERIKIMAERDALRELLRELWSKQDLRFYDDEYLARIDAALGDKQ